MIVIADASPVNYLVLVRATDVLPKLFQRVLIPAEVHAELCYPGTPTEVRLWVEEAPRWLEIRHPARAADAALADLDEGEAAAIRLAEELRPNVLLLMNDAKGRREATRRGIPSIGTLGVLEAASKKGYLELAEILPRLLETNFYVTTQLVESLIAEERSRRK